MMNKLGEIIREFDERVNYINDRLSTCPLGEPSVEELNGLEEQLNKLLNVVRLRFEEEYGYTGTEGYIALLKESEDKLRSKIPSVMYREMLLQQNAELVACAYVKGSQYAIYGRGGSLVEQLEDNRDKIFRGKLGELGSSCQVSWGDEKRKCAEERIEKIRVILRGRNGSRLQYAKDLREYFHEIVDYMWVKWND